MSPNHPIICTMPCAAGCGGRGSRRLHSALRSHSGFVRKHAALENRWQWPRLAYIRPHRCCFLPAKGAFYNGDDNVGKLPDMPQTDDDATSTHSSAIIGTNHCIRRVQRLLIPPTMTSNDTVASAIPEEGRMSKAKVNARETEFA